MAKVAVLTNDLQYELVNKNDERVRAVRSATPVLAGFLHRMRALGHPVFHLQLINKPEDPNAERYNGHLPVTKGSDGARILTEFLDGRDVVVEKNKDSGFFETALDEELRKADVSSVVITGMQTQICVQTTAADAFFRGYNVWVPTDGVMSAREDDKKRALDWLDSYCATVSTTQEILATLADAPDLPRKVIRTP